MEAACRPCRASGRRDVGLLLAGGIRQARVVGGTGSFADFAACRGADLMACRPCRASARFDVRWTRPNRAVSEEFPGSDKEST